MNKLATLKCRKCQSTISILELLLLFLSITLPSYGQPDSTTGRIRSASSIPCGVHTFSEEIINFLQGERDKLVAKGILSAKKHTQRSHMTTTLEWPLRQVPGYSNTTYYALVNHVDLDPGTGIQDYNCGTKTYNGHNGNDISIFPFWWSMMNQNRVEVVAAAPGIILGKHDGEFDMNCSFTGDWNAVFVEHADGSVAWYGHLKSGSLTSKTPGMSVSTGEYLGLVGSSGRSTNPHLHLEIRDSENDVIEPFAGDCNSTTATSWWSSQRDYWDPKINILYTHDMAPNIDFCPETEKTNFQNNFSAGDSIRYGIYLSDQQDGLLASFEVQNPNGDLVHSWSRNYSGDLTWNWWYYNRRLPDDAVPGLYTFTATYAGEVAQHYFMVDCPKELGLDFETIRENIIYQANSSIITSNEIIVYSAGGLSAFEAGDFIEINDPFTVTPGSEFEIRIGGCPTELNPGSPPVLTQEKR